MIKHIVLWKVKELADGLDRPQIAAKMKHDLEALRPVIPAIRHLEVGVNCIPSDAAFDVALYSEFDSRTDLEAYMTHPAHQAVVGFVRSVVTARHVVDYEA
ncbi:MAG TPA: Dabb family protein [Kiritimatiellia bacterium]|nr:Dabb family protein [Kiritimatiellia bacterium]HMP33528.1 Dabb family protein [Kiritimatiellia bacterium]